MDPHGESIPEPHQTFRCSLGVLVYFWPRPSLSRVLTLSGARTHLSEERQHLATEKDFGPTSLQKQ